MVNCKDTDGINPQEINTVKTLPIFTTPVMIGAGPSASPTRIRIQDIDIQRWSIVTQEVRIDQPFDTSFNGISAKQRYPAPT